MNDNRDKLENMFQKHADNWDIYELKPNHQEVFFDKLNNKKSKRNYFIPFAIAASLLLIVGFSFFYQTN